MMACRPGAQVQAEAMTQDLYRLFTQYYLKIGKHGNVSHFVCDFMEGENGLMYLLQVKSFECEGVIHDWQKPFEPNTTSSSPIKKDKLEDEPEELYPCQAKIICDMEKY